MHHSTLFAKRAENQSSLNWLMPHSMSLSSIMDYD